MSTTPRLAALLALVVLAAGLPAVGGAQSDLQWGDERAQLTIEQPSYVDNSIEREETANRTIYRVNGPEQSIRLSQSHADVVDYGILEGEGTLQYDSRSDAYRLSVDEAGSRVLYWDIEETRTVQSGNETREETVTVRHVATLSVSNVDWAHRPAEEDAAMQQDAQNWTAISATLNDRASVGQSPQDVFDNMVQIYDFAERPFSSFAADARGTIILMTTRPGGIAVTGTIIGLGTIAFVLTARRLRRKEEQLETVDDIEQARDQAHLEQARKNAQQVSLNDHFPDDLARSLRDRVGGNNLWAAWRHYSLIRSPTHAKGVTLQLMQQLGYRLRVHRGPGGGVEAAHVIHEDDQPDAAADGGTEVETVDPMGLSFDDADDRDVIAAVPFDELDREVYHSRADEVDGSKVDLPIDPQEIEDSELVEALNPDFPGDFDDPEQMAELLADMLGYVVEHPVYTNEQGEVREEMDILAALTELDSLAADVAGAPVADMQRRILMLTVEEMDKGERLQDRVDELRSSAPGIDRPTSADDTPEDDPEQSAQPATDGHDVVIPDDYVTESDTELPVDDHADKDVLDPLEQPERMETLGVDVEEFPSQVLDETVTPEDREQRLLEWVAAQDDPDAVLDVNHDEDDTEGGEQ